MAESSWPTSEVTRDYLQNLISKGYMIAAEFATYLVPTRPKSLAPVEGFFMVCVAFYEWRFGMPSHRTLHSLLRSYGLELHHPTPSGILHMAAFVTLCEAYIGIEPLLNTWSHFFGPGCGIIQSRERHPLVVWIFWSALVLGLILTLKKLAFNYLAIYFFITFFFSWVKQQSHCLTCLASGTRWSSCSINSLRTPRMSAGFHAKMSLFS
jgi:hypothetical protein